MPSTTASATTSNNSASKAVAVVVVVSKVAVAKVADVELRAVVEDKQLPEVDKPGEPTVAADAAAARHESLLLRRRPRSR